MNKQMNPLPCVGICQMAILHWTSPDHPLYSWPHTVVRESCYIEPKATFLCNLYPPASFCLLSLQETILPPNCPFQNQQQQHHLGTSLKCRLLKKNKQKKQCRLPGLIPDGLKNTETDTGAQSSVVITLWMILMQNHYPRPQVCNIYLRQANFRNIHLSHPSHPVSFWAKETPKSCHQNSSCVFI